MIARKRLERAQDRDGLHVDLAELAQKMSEFSIENVLWRHDVPSSIEKDEVCNTTDDEISGGGEASDADDSSSSRASSRSSVSIENNESQTDQMKQITAPTRDSICNNPRILMLDPLSGCHLKAAKRLAGYFRLQWTEQGCGKCRSLELTAKPGPQAAPETNAAAALIIKYKAIENGATTKRLPTADCTPQFSGSQAIYLSFRKLKICQ